MADIDDPCAFLEGGGEMTALMCDFDWASTPLGPIETWPQSLKTTTSLLLRSPVPIVLLWGEDGVMIYNEAYSIFAGERHPRLLGSKVREGWPEVADFNDNVMKVGLAGGTLAYRDQELTLYRGEGGRGEQVFMDLDYSPVVDESGRPGGVIAIVVDTTQRVLAARSQRANEARLAFLDALSQATAAGTDADEIMAITTRVVGEHMGVSNCAYADMDEDQDGFTIRGDWAAPGSPHILGHYRLADFGKLAVKELKAGRPLVINDNLTEIAPEEAATFQAVGIGATICMPLIRDGRLTALMAIHHKGPHRWTPDELALITEVTERSWAHIQRVGIEAALRESEARYRTLFETIDQGFCILEVMFDDQDEATDYRFLETNPAFERHTGLSRAVGRTALELVPDLERQWIDLYARVALTGEAAHFEQGSDAMGRWFEVRALRVGEPEERRVALLFTDVSERRGTDAALRAEKRALEILNEAGAIVAADTDLASIVQRVTDAGVALSGAEFGAFFYNVLDERGESYMLYSLSGAPPEAFSKFPMPRNTAVFGPTFEGEGIVRSDDITKDPRYGKNAPRKGMPECHLPVRSYLAVPVKSRTGEVLGGLFFGHPEAGRFGDDAERGLEGLAGQAAVAIDNARLFQEAQTEIARRAAAEAELQALNATLEGRVQAELTQRLDAEQALHQSQKMETVGQLTGGVAHDFNNLLTPIVGALDLLRRRLDGDERAQRLTEGALQSAERAQVLVHRLLAFSRRQHLQPRAVDVRILVENLSDLITRSIGPRIELVTDMADCALPAHVDPNQLELALLNLAVNARDAMPEGGRLTIACAADERDDAGRFLRLSVTDTGVGMDEATLARAVEPFFTTKGVGRGTGLGLSSVQGLAVQSGGAFELASIVGQGTTATLWLPVSSEPVGMDAVVEPAGLSPDGRRAVVLLIDDEEVVRHATAEMLAEAGYGVIQAGGAADALELLNGGVEIEAVVTDYAMPGQTGAELARQLRTLRPELPILLITGYAAIAEDEIDDLPRLAKPFRQAELAAAVAEVLEGLEREP